MAVESGSFTDNNGNALSSQLNGSQQALDVGVNVAGVQIDPRDTRLLTATDQITVAASALPAGASTAAKQDTGNASLASIDSKLTNPLPVSVVPVPGAFTDRSGTIGTSSVSIVPANPSRKYLFIQNNSTKVMWINFGVAAVANQPSIQIPVGGGAFTMEGSFVNSQQVFAISAAAGSAYTAKEG